MTWRRKKEKTLLLYLDGEFSQGLMRKQPLINEALIKYLDKKYQDDLEESSKQTKFHSLVGRYFQNPSILFSNINRIIDPALSHFQNSLDLNLLKKL